MLRFLRCAAVFGGLILSASALAVDVDPTSYGFPLTNPFEATIATTPADLRPDLPADADIDQADYTLNLRPERDFTLPDNFWAVKKLRYRLAKQNHPAPLVFLIAGTGAPYTSTLNEFLKKLYYGAGYNVVQLSSPSSFDFMSAASRFATPGVSKDDAEDLYRVMQAVRAQQSNVQITDYYLTGYSLGALDAAFVAHLAAGYKLTCEIARYRHRLPLQDDVPRGPHCAPSALGHRRSRAFPFPYPVLHPRFERGGGRVRHYE